VSGVRVKIGAGFGVGGGGGLQERLWSGRNPRL
jgi:hypothetical protein